MKIVITYSIRVILVYFFTYLSTRMMTKKAIAEMTAYEIAGVMILANVAAEPLVDKVVIKSIYGVGLLVALMLLAGRLATINKLTRFFEHTATIIIENGNIDMKALRKLSLSMNQLKGLLRQQGCDKVSDVQSAIFEPQGTLSVFLKGENKPVTLKDLNMSAINETITIPLILDGTIQHSNLKHIGKDEGWLISELKNNGIEDFVKEVAIAELDPSWKLTVLRKYN
jgi:uncharacterized membrane protein YcaP (DUF421 family)